MQLHSAQSHLMSFKALVMVEYQRSLAATGIHSHTHTHHTALYTPGNIVKTLGQSQYTSKRCKESLFGTAMLLLQCACVARIYILAVAKCQ